jgi:4-amino-4-deoxy-L-arabinose transferase-like glycosyltransferase
MALAAGLRFWTIGRGLPYSVGADEPDIMIRVLHMLQTGDFNPHGFFDYPTLTFYEQLIVAGARFITGAVRGEWITLAQIWPGDFYLWARSLNALLSIATVYVAYRAARRWTPMTALVAALALAVQPQLVREAHFALTDTPLTFFIALTMLLSLCACEAGRLRWFLLAGVAAGLAAATKYNGGTAILMPLAATLRVGELRSRTLAVLGVVLGAAAAFLVGAPYSIIDLPGFLNGFAALIQHYNQERAPGDPASLIYLKHIADWFSVITPGGHLYRITSWPALALCGLGALSLLVGALRPSRLPESLIVLVFPFAYFWFISNHSLVFARYAMPVLPAMCLAFGRGVDVIWSRLPGWLPQLRHRRIALAAMLLTLAPAAWQAFGFDVDRRQASTTELTAAWLVDHVQPDESVMIESSAIALPPTVRAANTLRLISEPIDAYREKGVTYLVSTSSETDKYFRQPDRFPNQVASYKALLQGTTIAMTFSPTKDRPGPTWQILRVNK